MDGRVVLLGSMDVHEHLPEGATADDVADAHAANLRVQDGYDAGKVFCLVQAPDAETAPTDADQPLGTRTAAV